MVNQMKSFEDHNMTSITLTNSKQLYYGGNFVCIAKPGKAKFYFMRINDPAKSLEILY